MLGLVKTLAVIALFLAYPYLIHSGLENGLAWIAPVGFSIIYWYRAYTARTAKIRLYQVAIASALLLGGYFLQAFTAKALPVLIQLLLMFFFGRTLLKDQGPPLIEIFVRLEFPELPPEIIDYCRRLTWLWTGFFAVNVGLCLILAVFGSDFWWTVFNGVIIYLMIGILVAGEYIYRRFRFPELDIPDPKSTLKTLIVNGRKIWLQVQTR